MRPSSAFPKDSSQQAHPLSMKITHARLFRTHRQITEFASDPLPLWRILLRLSSCLIWVYLILANIHPVLTLLAVVLFAAFLYVVYLSSFTKPLLARAVARVLPPTPATSFIAYRLDPRLARPDAAAILICTVTRSHHTNSQAAIIAEVTKNLEKVYSYIYRSTSGLEKELLPSILSSLDVLITHPDSANELLTLTIRANRDASMYPRNSAAFLEEALAQAAQIRLVIGSDPYALDVVASLIPPFMENTPAHNFYKPEDVYKELIALTNTLLTAP